MNKKNFCLLISGNRKSKISENMTPEPDPLQLKLDRLFATIEDRKRRQSDERKKKQDQRIQQLTTRRPLWWQND